jgi:hypothetical protein
MNLSSFAKVLKQKWDPMLTIFSSLPFTNGRTLNTPLAPPMDFVASPHVGQPHASALFTGRAKIPPKFHEPEMNDD